MTELQSLTSKARSGQSIGATRAYSKPIKTSGHYLEAVKEVALLMGRDNWHKVSVISRVCRKHHTTFKRIADELKIAESVSGTWCCIPYEDTPPAPDERTAS